MLALKTTEIYKTLPQLKFKEHCRREGEKIVRARGAESLLQDCVSL